MNRFTNFLLKGWMIAAFAFNFASAEFQSVSLGGTLAGSTIEHRVNLNDPAANGRATVTIRYTVPRSTWVSVGVSPTGSMNNGEVVIAKPSERTIRKYRMTGKSGAAISELPNQSLVNATFAQSGGVTVLTYTKILVEDGELAINGDGRNTFIAAFGSSNAFGFHQGYGSAVVTLSAPATDPPVPAPTVAPVPTPTEAPVAAPTQVPVPAPTETPVAAPTEVPVPAPTEDPVLAPTTTPYSGGFRQVPMGGVLARTSFQYRLNRNDVNADGADTVSIQFTCPGNVWVGVGVSESETMVPAKAVMGFPGSANLPLQYFMASRDVTGVTPLAENEKVLIDPQITFANDQTTLSYTQPVYAAGMTTSNEGLEVHADGRSNNFILACGTSADPSFHQLYGHMTTTVEEGDAPIPAPLTPAPTTMAAPVPTPVVLDFEEVPLSGMLSEATFRYHVNRKDDKADGADTITIEFTCPGNVWVGVGVSEFGAMAPAKAVLGFPESGSPPIEYFMESKSVEGVNPLPEQTLIDPQISFANDRTTLMYTQTLHSSGATTTSNAQDEEFEIRADGSNTNFIGACGTSAGPSFHRLFGSFGVTVKDAAPVQEVGFREVAISGALAEADFKYRLNRNDIMADGADTITIEYSCPGNVWVGVGVSEFGAMAPANAVMGFPEGGSPPYQAFMESKSVEGVNPLPEQTLIDPQISFANDRTTLRYTLPIFPTGAISTTNVGNEALEIHADGRMNNFIGACGTNAGPSFHRLFGSFGVIVEEGDIEAPTVPAPFAAPTSPPGADILELTGELEGATLGYVFTYDDPAAGGRDTITVTYTAPITGWLSVGASETGLMVGSDAVIGIPAIGEVKKYYLSSKAGDLSGVTVMPDEKQTLLNAAITQANGTTTLTYTKILVEEDEVAINRVGDNIFIAAHGISNTLGFHSVRGSFSLSGRIVERDSSLWLVHGWLAAIAWGLFCPLAILAGLFRKYIPGQGTWYQIHRVLQSLVVLLTIASVIVAIVALNKETPARLSANHFSVEFADGHRTIGLVIFIFAFLQGVNGITRPHLPPKPDEANDDEEGNKGAPTQTEEKSGARKAWEVLHRLLGVGLLALSWYQIDLGIFWYHEIFNDGESASTLNIFYAVIGVLGALIAIGVAMRVLMG